MILGTNFNILDTGQKKCQMSGTQQPMHTQQQIQVVAMYTQSLGGRVFMKNFLGCWWGSNPRPLGRQSDG